MVSDETANQLNIKKSENKSIYNFFFGRTQGNK